MLDKFGFPEKYIINSEVSLTDFFSQNEIESYGAKSCNLFATINSDSFDKQKAETHDEIQFYLIKISTLLAHSDLYKIVQNITKKSKYKVIILIQIEDMYKIGCTYTGASQSEDGNNKHFIFSQWIYEDYETKEMIQFYEDFKKIVVDAVSIKELFSLLFTKISSLSISMESENIKPAKIKRMLKKILPSDCVKNVTNEILNNTFSYKIYKHSDGKKYQVNENDAVKVYPIECFWHSLKKIPITNQILEKRRVYNYEDLYWNNYIDNE